MRSHQIVSDSSVTFNVSDSLTDSGSGSQNRVSTVYGFELLTKPVAGDLLGTTFESAPPAGREAEHVWAGEDRGATMAGFLNNAAIGRLSLNGDVRSAFRFKAAGAKNAMYVDYLDISASVRDDLRGSLSIDENFTIYFAAASVPVEQLDGALDGRLRWVKDFAGPNSSVEILLRDGRSAFVNRGLRESLVIDSDGDGIANGQDLYPFDGAGRVRINTAAGKVQIQWDGAAQTEYTIESTPALSGSTWTAVGTVKNSSDATQTLRFEEPLGASRVNRYYRIRSNGP